MHTSGKMTQILQFLSQTSDKEGREYEEIGERLKTSKPSEVADRLKNVLHGKEGGQDDSTYYNTVGNLLFAIETVRNPGAVISNIIYLDELARKGSKLKSENIHNDLPMAFKGAVDGARALHEELRPYLKDRTYYDYGSGGRERDKNLIKTRDTKLLVNWLKHNDIDLGKDLTKYRRLLNKTTLDLYTLDNRTDTEKEVANKGEEALTGLFADEKIYKDVKDKLQKLVKNWYQSDIELDLPAIGRKSDKIAFQKVRLEIKDQDSSKSQANKDKSEAKVTETIKLNIPIQDIENAFNQKDNQKYWLQDKDITQILKFKKNNNNFSQDKVKDCVILPVFNGNDAENLANNSARNGVKAEIQSLRAGENLVGLANHGNHWTAFKIIKDTNNKLSCQFMNSSTADAYFDQFQQTLRNLNVGIDKSRISVIQCNQQTDRSACGFFALENAQRLANNSDIKIQDTFSQTSVVDTRKLYGQIYAEQAVSDVAKTLVNNLETQRVIDFSAEEKKIKAAISGLANDANVSVGRVAEEDRLSKGNYQYTITVNNDPATIKKISDFLKSNTSTAIEPDKEGAKCKFYIPRKDVQNEEFKKMIEVKDKEMDAEAKNYSLKSIKVQIVKNHEIAGPYDSKLYDKSGNKELSLPDLLKTDSATLKLKKEYIENHLILTNDKKLSAEALQIVNNLSLKLEGSVWKVEQKGKAKDLDLSKLQEEESKITIGEKRSREDNEKDEDKKQYHKKQRLVESTAKEIQVDNKQINMQYITFRRKRKVREESKSDISPPITKKQEYVAAQPKLENSQTSPPKLPQFSQQDLKIIHDVGKILSPHKIPHKTSPNPSSTKPSPAKQNYMSRSSSSQSL